MAYFRDQLTETNVVGDNINTIFDEIENRVSDIISIIDKHEKMTASELVDAVENIEVKLDNLSSDLY